MRFFQRTFSKLFLPHFVLLGIVAMVLMSCHKNDYPATPVQSALKDYIGKEQNLSIFQAALKRSGLDSLLANDGPYTVFAPVDSAFIVAGLTLDRINSYDKQALRRLLSFHVLPGRIGSATVTGFISDTMKSFNPQYSPIITQNYYGLFLNGIKVVKGNVALANGVLHEINGVSFPPTNNLLQTLDSLPNTKMASYIFHKSIPYAVLATNPASVFKKLGPNESGYQLWVNNGVVYSSLTFLVPSDDAFRKFGYNTTADLDKLDSTTRTTMVATGILMSSLFTCDFVGGRFVGSSQSSTPANGRASLIGFGLLQYVYHDGATGQDNNLQMYNYSGSFEFGNDGLSLLGAGIVTPPRLTQTNILANNGVVHVIDQIFAPNGNIVVGGPN